MNVQTISSEVKEARGKLAEYRAALKKQWNKTDQILFHTYRQLAKGRMLIDVRSAILGAGFDEHHRPKIAIARADQEFVWWRPYFYGRGSGGSTSSLNSSVNQSSAREFNFAIPREARPCVNACPASHNANAKAMVPLIPPRFRPDANRLSGYHILWDVEGAWEAEPPKDPFLLKRISGDLFAVLAVWDLTEPERSVLKGIRAGAN